MNVSRAERRRIVEAGWAERLAGERLFVAYRFAGRRRHCLAHRPDGRCVFLGDDEKCRLHAETGLDTKPLACRLYPFAPTPGVGSVRIDVRGDCPSVAANRGRALSVHQSALRRLVAETRAAPLTHAPSWRGARAITFTEFEAVTAGFDRLLARRSLPYRARLRVGGRLLDLLATIRIDQVRGDRFVELMNLLSEGAMEEAGNAGPASRPPARAGRLFREWLFLHAIADDPAEVRMGLAGKLLRSWGRYAQARRFARGRGPIPPVRSDWPVTDFEAVARVRPGEDATLEPVCRSLQVKLSAQAFAGPAYYGYDLLAGLTALWLLPAVAGWFARLAAVAGGRDTLTEADVCEGLRQAHHTYGVSPVFGRISERLRLRWLSRPGVASALLAYYGP